MFHFHLVRYTLNTDGHFDHLAFVSHVLYTGHMAYDRVRAAYDAERERGLHLSHPVIVECFDRCQLTRPITRHAFEFQP